MTLNCKAVGIIKSEFLAKTPFLSNRRIFIKTLKVQLWMVDDTLDKGNFVGLC